MNKIIAYGIEITSGCWYVRQTIIQFSYGRCIDFYAYYYPDSIKELDSAVCGWKLKSLKQKK